VQITFRRKSNCVLLGVTLLMLSLSAPAQSATDDGRRFAVDVEFGPVWFARNDIRIPGDGGTKFDMTDLAGTGPEFFARIGGLWRITDKHSLRLVLAPLEVEGRGTLTADTEFAGEVFPAGATDGTYKFNAYKLSYRYTFPERATWRWRAGFTAVIRDANVELRQGSLQANDSNVGFVPALHLSGEYLLSDRWRFSLDFDGLAGGPGRLFDVALKLEYGFSERWRVAAGYRALEGGADTDDVYSFGWLNYGVLGVTYRFGDD